MRVAVSATEASLDAAVDPRFGRCRYFAVVDSESMAAEFLENTAAGMGSGAGIQAARLLADRDVECVLTGDCGPNATETLSAAGIAIVLDCGGSVREAVARWRESRPERRSEPQHVGAPASMHSGLTAAAPFLGSSIGAGGGRQRRRDRVGCRGLGRQRGYGKAVGAPRGRGRG